MNVLFLIMKVENRLVKKDLKFTLKQQNKFLNIENPLVITTIASQLLTYHPGFQSEPCPYVECIKL